jgi:hypothetical protein
MDSSKKSLWPLSLLIADFCNKIGTSQTSANVRCSLAIGGKADITPVIVCSTP